MNFLTRIAKTVLLLLIGFVLALGAVFSLWQFVFYAIFNPKKAWKIALAIDMTTNVAANGRLGQSISARAALAQLNGKKWGCVMCKYLLNFVNPGHCERALIDPNQNLELDKQ